MTEVNPNDFSLDTLDDLPDLPEFTTFPTGAYVVELKEGIVAKTVADHPAYTAKLTLVEIHEIEDGALLEGEAPPKPGDSCDIVFMLDNDYGKGALKKFLTPIGTAMGTKDIKTIAAALKGAKLGILGKRDVKGEKKYFRVINALPV